VFCCRKVSPIRRYLTTRLGGHKLFEDPFPDESPMPRTLYDLWNEAFEEVFAYVKHTLCVLILLGCVLLVVLLSELIGHVCGERLRWFCFVLEIIDQIAGIGTLCFFALTMFLTLTELTFKLVWLGWPGLLVRKVAEWFKGPLAPPPPPPPAQPTVTTNPVTPMDDE
jgi:hypothetical protein